MFKHKEIPADISEVSVPAAAVRDGLVSLPHLLAGVGLAKSNTDARGLIKQGGVKVDGKPLTDPEATLTLAQLAGKVVQVGQRRMVRIAP